MQAINDSEQQCDFLNPQTLRRCRHSADAEHLGVYFCDKHNGRAQRLFRWIAQGDSSVESAQRGGVIATH